MSKRVVALMVLGVAAAAALVAWALSRIDVRAYAASLQGARLMPWLPLAVASYLAGHWVRGLRCRRLASPEATLSLATATNVVVLGYAVNNLLPVRLGELARAGMLAERTGLSFAQTMTITVLERLLDGLVLLAFLAATLSVVPHGGGVTTTLVVAGAVLGIVTLKAAVAIAAPGWMIGFVSGLTRFLPEHWHDRAVGVAGAVANGAAYLRRPADAARVVALSVVVWLLEAGMFLALLPAFGLAPSPVTALFAMSATNLGVLVPTTPGAVGVFHVVCMQALAATGVGRETALGYATLVHLAFYVPITLWGVAVLCGFGLSLGRVMALGRSAEEVAEPPFAGGAAIPYSRGGRSRALSPPSPFLVSLCDALIPVDDGVVGEERARVTVETARFVHGQVEALPVRLRSLVGAGLAGFRVATVLAHGRTFGALPPERRRDWAAAWAYGPVEPARRLFRPLRSTALLAYYDSDAVRARRARELATPAGRNADAGR